MFSLVISIIEHLNSRFQTSSLATDGTLSNNQLTVQQSLLNALILSMWLCVSKARVYWGWCTVRTRTSPFLTFCCHQNVKIRRRGVVGRRWFLHIQQGPRLLWYSSALRTHARYKAFPIFNVLVLIMLKITESIVSADIRLKNHQQKTSFV